MKAEHLREGDVIHVVGAADPMTLKTLRPSLKQLLDEVGFTVISKVPASRIRLLANLRIGDRIAWHVTGVRDDTCGVVKAFDPSGRMNPCVSCDDGIEREAPIHWHCTDRVDDLEAAAATPAPSAKPVHIEHFKWHPKGLATVLQAAEGASERGQSWLRRNLREWPYGKRLEEKVLGSESAGFWLEFYLVDEATK